MAYKRFLLFAYDNYYPGGGIGDVRGSFDTLEEAIKAAKAAREDFAHVFACDLRAVVWDSDE